MTSVRKKDGFHLSRDSNQEHSDYRYTALKLRRKFGVFHPVFISPCI